MTIFSYEFMIRALIAAVIIGIAAPAVGIYLVQRRMSLLGDGIGHIALTGVAAGLVLNLPPVATAIAASVIGAVVIETIRQHGKSSGDVAVAMMFYGGIAVGVLLISTASTRTTGNLLSYLFGSLLTVTWDEIIIIAALGITVVLLAIFLKPWLFAVCYDVEHALVSGLPTRILNLVLAITAALTVSVAMRAVGLLLVSALMVVPVAAAQQISRSFSMTLVFAITIGTIASVGGAFGSFYYDAASGASIVVLALTIFLLCTIGAAVSNTLLRKKWNTRTEVTKR